MAVEFHLPDIGEGLTEATIVSWYVEVGEPIGMDEPLVEVETDKAIVDIPSPVAGVLLHRGGAEGDVVEVERLLAVVGEPGETWEPAETRSGPTEPTSGTSGAAPIVGRIDETGEVVPGPGGRRTMLPLVRRLASELSVDPATITGTGPGGRITETDVRTAAAHSAPGGAEGVGAAGVVESDRSDERRVPMSPLRRSIAEHLARSWREIPHVTTYGAADATAVLAERRHLAADGGTVPLEAVLIRRLLPLLVEFPDFNASVDGDAIVHKLHYDIGVAVDTPDGLMVAVVRDAPEREITALGSEIGRLSAAARNRTARPDELRGATFTLSNIGAVGGRYGTPIVPYGTTAILSVGRADPLPVVRDDVVVVGRDLPLSLSYDHRAIDGSTGRAFMAALVIALEAGAPG